MLEHEIEARAVRVIALRQPVASDLREAISAIKISSDLERIGDLAKNIAKRVLIIQGDLGTPMYLMKGIIRMGYLAQDQLRSVLDACANRDARVAINVWRDDEEIDEMYNAVFNELLTYMMEDQNIISVCMHLMFIAKNIERIGDYATNIAEIVHYIATGEYMSDDRPKSDKISPASVRVL
jgi:phosphate transport system protein